MNLFDTFAQKRVTVIGDMMLDSYLTGKVERISPEAPVPVVLLKSKVHRLGGAANVALNLRALGASVHLFSVIGNDDEGNAMLNLLEKEQINTQGVIRSNSRPTTVKTRIMGNQVQMLRIDREETNPLLEQEKQLLLSEFDKQVQHTDVVIFSDYDKGLLQPDIIERIISICRTHHIPTVVDPKKNNFSAYKGVTLFKPNLKELKDGLGYAIDPTKADSIERALKQLHQEFEISNVMITLSELGMFLSNGTQVISEPAHLRSIADVSGAGDTVVAVASLCLASKLPIEKILAWSNLSGGIVCEYPGVIPIQKDRLIQEAHKLNLTSEL